MRVDILKNLGNNHNFRKGMFIKIVISYLRSLFETPEQSEGRVGICIGWGAWKFVRAGAGGRFGI